MKWKVRKPHTRHRRLHMWHVWFAWYPVRIPSKGKMSGMTKIWLEKVNRKGEYSCDIDGCCWNWEYKGINT